MNNQTSRADVLAEFAKGLLHRNTVQRARILTAVYRLREMHAGGELGGELMPEDVHPELPKDSAHLFHYFTFGMALNYQRDSYALWRAATATFDDPWTRAVFEPAEVIRMSERELADRLLRHRLALQHTRHPAIWMRLAASMVDLLDGDIRNLFSATGANVTEILDFIQRQHKSRFPYLSGPKIAHYWLYVLDQYTSAGLQDRASLSVAPDTHVIQASIRLGLVPSGVHQVEAQPLVNAAWSLLFTDTDLLPIDIHTPLWLWSRSKFKLDPCFAEAIC